MIYRLEKVKVNKF